MKVNKAYEITDAKIQFVSLVDKAANLKSFLITKAKDGQATFSTYGRLVVKDADKHFVTGVVYEPMAEDAHGNFMTEKEITKAAYYFAKAGGKIDLQHNFEPASGVTVVESWIAKADFTLNGETIKKGTWLMTAEITDNDLWDAIEKGEITGFSMGGVGTYSEEDVDLTSVEKSATAEKKGLFKRLGAMLGLDLIEKGDMAELFAERTKSSQFWTAFNTLQDVLSRYDYYSDRTVFESNEEKIREALSDFSEIVQSILTSGAPLFKALAPEAPVAKAGKKMSCKNRDTLRGICDQLTTFLAEFDDPEEDDEQKPEGTEPKPNDENKEDKDVKKSEVEKIVQEAVAGAIAKAVGTEAPAPAAAAPAAAPAAAEAVTPEMIQKMVQEAVTKALTPPEQDEPITAEGIQKMVAEAVSKAVEPVLKARGVPSALNDAGNGSVEPVEKGQHYLHGIL